MVLLLAESLFIPILYFNCFYLINFLVTDFNKSNMESDDENSRTRQLSWGGTHSDC